MWSAARGGQSFFREEGWASLGPSAEGRAVHVIGAQEILQRNWRIGDTLRGDCVCPWKGWEAGSEREDGEGTGSDQGLMT